MTLPPAGLSPEAMFLLCSCKPNAKERNREMADILARPLDWNSLQELALHNRLKSLLYCRIKEAGLESGVPFEVLRTLEDIHQDTLFGNMAMSRELIGLVKAFEAAGIAMMPFKGPLLAADVYEDISHRQFWDLDLLIQPADVAKSTELLKSCGYAMQPLSDAGVADDLLEKKTEMIFQREDISLEIHWNIVDESYSHGFDYQSMWATARKVVFCGREVQTPAAEELFYALCIHGGEKHRWSRLKWVADIAQFLMRYRDLDWLRLAHMARQQKREIYLHEAAYLAHVFFAVPLPPHIADAVLGNWRVRADAALARGRIFRNDQGLPGYAEWKQYMKSHGTRLGIAGGAAQYIGAVLAPETKDRERLWLPPALRFLHFLYRPFRLLTGQKFNLLRRLR